MAKQSEEELAKLQIELTEHFEQEFLLKKDIYEIDRKNEDMAFQLFNRQMQLTKNKHKGLNCASIKSEILNLKRQIEENQIQKANQSKNLTK